MSMEETWPAHARTMLETAWHTEDALKLWLILRNPANTVSRSHMRTLCTKAPRPHASLKAWRTFLNECFPELDILLEEREGARQAALAAKLAHWKRDELTRLAESGPLWQHDSVTYPHAHAYVRALLDMGYASETTRRGKVLFRNGDRVIGPMDNTHVNAAVTLYAMT